MFALLDRRSELDRQAEQLADFRAGTIAAVIANTSRSPKDTRTYGWKDFFPDPQPVRRVQDDEEMLAAMQNWAKRRNLAPVN